MTEHRPSPIGDEISAEVRWEATRDWEATTGRRGDGLLRTAQGGDAGEGWTRGRMWMPSRRCLVFEWAYRCLAPLAHCPPTQKRIYYCVAG